MLVFSSCTKKEPAAPSAPANTATPGNTFTMTDTPTATHTGTPEDTHTATSTETGTATATNTGTPTETPTITPTMTPTLVVIVESGQTRRWADNTRACSCEEYIRPSNPAYAYSGATGDGVYSIEIGGDIFDTYCDMTYDNGGWTLVLLNSSHATPPQPYWDQVVNLQNITGDLFDGLTAFDMFLGVKFWNQLGDVLRVEAGAGPASLSHRSTYTFSLNVPDHFAISLSNENILIHTEGTASPGLYTYHNGRRLTTRDMDNDAYGSGNCSHAANNTAWWYGSCWSGSFWGSGGAGGSQNKPYWTGSGSGGEYFDWGAMWVR